MSQHLLYESIDVLVDISADDDATTSFQVPPWAVFVGVLVPDVDAGNVGIEISKDDSTFYPLVDPIDGADVVAVTSGSDPGWVDISDWIRFIPHIYYARLTTAAQGADKTFTICFRG